MTITSLVEAEIKPLVINLIPVINITDDQFFDFCQLNKELRIERNAQGSIVIMSPTGSETGGKNFSLIGQLAIWVEQDATGIGFDSSTGFTLPNGAVRSPDVSWIKREKWQAIPSEQRQKFAPVCPDFVIELKSPTDSLNTLQEKMEEYLENGASLGWLIDPKKKKVYVYQKNTEVLCLENPATISGEPLLSGFVLDLNKIWSFNY